MKRLLVIAILLVVAACGNDGGRTLSLGPSPLALSPGGATPAASAPTGSACPACGHAPYSIDPVLINPRGAGITVKPGTSGSADLDGGRYRVAWLAPACTTLTIEWVQATGGSTPIPVVLPSGETFVDLPAGTGSLDRTADCDYAVRFEAAK